jgi:hypothetical protein
MEIQPVCTKVCGNKIRKDFLEVAGFASVFVFVFIFTQIAQRVVGFVLPASF